MIFCIFGGGKCRPRWGVQRGLPLALLGNFQRYVVLRLGKFPNKLRYFLRKYPAACRLPARLPFGYGCPCRLLTRTDYTAQQIAEELNFSDQSAFGKFFKSKAGVSPHIFRLKGVNR